MIQKFIRMGLIAALIVSFTGLVSAQKNSEKIIRKILDTQTQSWNKGDIDNFMKGYWESDSLIFIGKNGTTYGWGATLKNYKKSYPDTMSMGILNFDIIKVEKLSKSYYNIVGKWFLTRSIGNIQGAFTLLFKKINGSWVIVQDHSS